MRKTVVAELKEAITAQESLIRTLRTDRDIPRVLQDSIDQTRAKIAKLQRNLDAMLDRQANTEPMLYAAIDHLKELKLKLQVEQHRAKVEQLLRLDAGVQELMEEINE